MKLIDQTPFYDENGNISFMDRARALMKYGKPWLDEMEAQKSVLPFFEKLLDKQFTLLRNVTPPELETPIPFILVGPPGIFVLYISPATGMFRAKGDQWGTISGSAFRQEKINLMARAERMARAVQLVLKRKGFTELLIVEAILLFTHPNVHVDSLRPIVRIVLRDALERFIISVSQARVVLSPEMVYDVVNRILNPPTPREEVPSPQVEEQLEEESTPDLDAWEGADIRLEPVQPSSADRTPSQVPFSDMPPGPPFTTEPSGQLFFEENTPLPSTESWQLPPDEFLPLEDTAQVPPESTFQPARSPRIKVTRRQWLFLAFMALIWCSLVGFFIYYIVFIQGISM